MVQYVDGDIFLTECQCIGHGVNIQGAMGVGIALKIKEKFPEAFKQYKIACNNKQLKTGSCQIVKDTNPWIINMATQFSFNGATYNNLNQCLNWIYSNYRKENIKSIAMPMIGCGYGKLNPEEVKKLIDYYLGPLSIPICVYENYIENLKSEENI